jgi:hypothetical protein
MWERVGATSFCVVTKPVPFVMQQNTSGNVHVEADVQNWRVIQRPRKWTEIQAALSHPWKIGSPRKL